MHVLLLLAMVSVIILINWGSLTSTSLRFTGFIAVTISVAVVAFMGAALQRDWGAIPVIYLVGFVAFHFGLLVLLVLGVAIPDWGGSSSVEWLRNSETVLAAWLSTLGVIAFSSGALVAWLRGARGGGSYIMGGVDERFAAGCSVTGLVLVTLGIGGWCWTILNSGGLALITASYGHFLGATASGSLPIFYFVIGLGVALLAAGAQGLSRRAGAVIFCAWACIAFGLGLRGDVLFPALTALAVVAKRRRLKLSVLALGALAVLALTGLVRDVRETGVVGLEGRTVEANPLLGLGELGYSLRPVSEVVKWHGQGSPYILGASYWAPIERQFIAPVFGIEKPDGEQDIRLTNVAVSRRVGPIGFSPIAEGYYNFGLWGVVAFMFLLGWMLGRMQAWPATPLRLAVIAVVLMPLMFQIRNSFTPVPAQVVGGLLLLWALWFLGGHDRRRRPASSPVEFVEWQPSRPG